MEYNEIKLRIATKDLETAEAIANLAVPYGIYIEDYSDIEELAPQIAHVDLIEQELLDRDRDHGIIHLYISLDQNPGEAVSFLRERLEAQEIGYTVEQTLVNEEDWATAWKKYYFPTKVGDRIVVVPSWEIYEKQENDLVLTMDPGMAFGTGTHDTTRLCMQLLEQYVDNNTTLLDIGTGSGILAVAAVLLGAVNATGVDIDEVAVRVAGENALANGTTERCTFLAGDLTDRVNGKFSLITANIVADVIIRLAPSLKTFLAEGGVFIASGIIEPRAGDVEEAIRQAGLTVVERRESGGWVALAARES